MDLILLIWLVLMLVALSLAFSVIQTYQASPKAVRQRHHRQKHQRKRHHERASFVRQNNSSLWRQLLTLVQSDTGVAERLVAQQRSIHPGKSDQW